MKETEEITYTLADQDWEILPDAPPIFNDAGDAYLWLIENRPDCGKAYVIDRSDGFPAAMFFEGNLYLHSDLVHAFMNG